MNKKKSNAALFFFLLINAVSYLGAEKVAVLDGVFRPDMMAFSDKYLYVSEKTTVHIYCLRDFKPVKKFGREGEGPKEFKINPMGAPLIVVPMGGKLLINSTAKVSIYTAEGEYIKEFKVPPNQVYIPFGDAYIYTGAAAGKDGKTVMAIILANSKFEKIKELYLSDWEIGAAMKFEFPISSLAFAPVGEKIYVVAGKEGFVIDIFDKSGKKLSRIKKDYQPLKLPSDYKTKTVKWFSNDPNWRNLYNIFKDMFSFKTHYPPIFQISGGENRLYLLTYKMRENDRECIIMDLKGKEIKRVFLPIPEVYGFDLLPKYTFHNQAFYILKENEDEEVIELHKIGVE